MVLVCLGGVRRGSGWWREVAVSSRPIRRRNSHKKVHILCFKTELKISSSHFSYSAPENMYMYEGEDYSKASDSDKKTFDQLLAGEYIYCLHVRTNNFAHPPLDHSEQLRLSEEELGESVLRGERAVHLSLPAGPTRKRKPLTEEQLLERRRKVRFSLYKAITIPVR